MKNFILLLIGAIIGNIIVACSMGGKRPNYNEFPSRSKDNTVWMKCIDGDKNNVCKYSCSKYSKKNECKKNHQHVDKMLITESLDKGFVIISRSFFLQLLRGKK